MPHHDAGFRQALEEGHFDIGAGHDVEHAGAGHAHHMRHDHQHQGQHRQEGEVQPFQQGVFRRDIGERGKQTPAHGEVFHQQVAHQIFRHGNGEQGDEVHRTVVPGILIDRREQPEQHRQWHRNTRGKSGEEEAVAQARRQLLGHGVLVGQADAEIALRGVADPFGVAHRRRTIQPELGAHFGDVFRRRRILQDRGRQIPRQQLRARENEHGGCQDRHRAKGQSQHDQAQHGMAFQTTPSSSRAR